MNHQRTQQRLKLRQARWATQRALQTIRRAERGLGADDEAPQEPGTEQTAVHRRGAAMIVGPLLLFAGIVYLAGRSR